MRGRGRRSIDRNVVIAAKRGSSEPAENDAVLVGDEAHVPARGADALAHLGHAILRAASRHVGAGVRSDPRAAGSLRASHYLHAAQQLGVSPEQCVLIAVHSWDIDGAKRAGLRVGWLDRRGDRYPGFFERPDAAEKTLAALAEALISGG